MQSFIGQRRVSETPKNEGTDLKKNSSHSPVPWDGFYSNKKRFKATIDKAAEETGIMCRGGKSKMTLCKE